MLPPGLVQGRVEHNWYEPFTWGTGSTERKTESGLVFQYTLKNHSPVTWLVFMLPDLKLKWLLSSPSVLADSHALDAPKLLTNIV